MPSRCASWKRGAVSGEGMLGSKKASISSCAVIHQRGKNVVSVSSGNTARSQRCSAACRNSSISRLTTAGRRSLRAIGPIWQAPTVMSRDMLPPPPGCGPRWARESDNDCPIEGSEPADNGTRSPEPRSGCAPLYRQELQQGGVEAVGRLVGNPMPRLLDQSHLELGMMLAHDLEPSVERAAGDDVFGSPDRLYGRRDVGQRLGEPVTGCERPASEARALDVLGLQMNGEGIDIGGVGDHQHPQVLLEHRRDLLRTHAGALFGEALTGFGAQAECGHADQGQMANAFAQARRRQAGDVAAEGEAGEAQIMRARQQLIERGNDDVGTGCGNEGLG